MTLLYQIDASVAGSLFADTAKTTPITNGTGVAAAAPVAGSITTDALQATSGSRPTYRANYSSSGYPALEYDGSSDYLAVAHSAAWNVSVLDIFAVVTITNSASAQGIITKWTNSGWSDAWGVAMNNGAFACGSPAYTSFSAKITTNQRMLIHCHLQASNNCGEFGPVYGGSTSGAGPSNNSASVMIGRADNTTSGYWIYGAIHEVRVYGGGETDQTIVDVKNNLRSKWGLAHVTARTAHPMFQQVIG